MRTAHSGDRGFTLIESAVALLIAAFIFTALGQTVATALRASGERRLEQQATALTNEAVELVRDLGFDEVALLPPASDPTRLPVSTFDPGTGPENIFEDPAGGIPLQVTSETFNGITYTLTRYVTWVDDDPLDSQTEDYKRFTVIADWTSRGVTRTEQLETFIALQSAEVGASNPTYGASFNPPFDKKFGRESTDIVFLHTITNIGNRDDYFEMTITNDQGWPVTIRDAVSGLPLVDWTGEGTPDTGLLTPNPDAGSTLDVEIVVSVPAGMPVGEFSLTTMEATSVGDPGSSSSANDIAVSTGEFTPSNVALYLKSGMTLSPAEPIGAPSTASGPSGTTLTWVMPVSVGWEAVSDGDFRLYVGRRGTCAPETVAYDVTIRTTSGIWATASSGDVAIAGCTPELGKVTLPIEGSTVLAGEFFFVDVTITKVANGNPEQRGLTAYFDGIDTASVLEFAAVAL